MEPILFISCLVLGTLAVCFFALWQKSRHRYQLLHTEAEKDLTILQQQLDALHTRQEDREALHKESLEKVESKLSETSRKLFKEESEQLHEKTTKRFQEISELVSVMKDELGKNTTHVDTLFKTLSAPGKAGSFSEFSLENTFKHYGLEAGKDYIMQYTITGEQTVDSKKRPDAIVFLPGGNILVIDSKASTYFLKLAEAESEEEVQELEKKMVKRMQTHLKDLASKGYKEAVLELYKRTGKTENIRQIMTLMYVQSEVSVQKIIDADPEFKNQCSKEDIILSGPTGLAGLMSIARYSVLQEQQQQNHTHIEEISGLLNHIRVMFDHAGKAGKALSNAAHHYDNFVKSVNKNFLPKARKITEMGVTLPKQKSLPASLPHVNKHAVIEGESETLSDIQEISASANDE